jgi:hypothetical protein
VLTFYVADILLTIANLDKIFSQKNKFGGKELSLPK